MKSLKDEISSGEDHAQKAEDKHLASVPESCRDCKSVFVCGWKHRHKECDGKE